MTEPDSTPYPKPWRLALVAAVLAINIVLCIMYPFKLHKTSNQGFVQQQTIHRDWQEKCKGNVFILYAGFDESNTNHQIIAASIYFNAVYALPSEQAVYAAHPDTVINNGKDILHYQHRANLFPDFFAGLQIKTVVLATLSPNGGVNIEFKPWKVP